MFLDHWNVIFKTKETHFFAPDNFAYRCVSCLVMYEFTSVSHAFHDRSLFRIGKQIRIDRFWQTTNRFQWTLVNLYQLQSKKEKGYYLTLSSYTVRRTGIFQ